MPSLNEPPIFIVGTPRSGTTLLRFILSSHPRIYIPSETGFIPFLRQRTDSSLSISQVQDVLQQTGRLNASWRGLVHNVNEFYRGLREPTLEHVLDALYRIKVSDQSAERWGDKTPSYALYIPQLTHIFPTAQFIHVIRDGRDATLSARRKWGAKAWYMDNYYLLKNWVRHVSHARSAGENLDTCRYLEVRYESLVEKPGDQVEQICGFLGESFHPAMLGHTELAARRIGPAGHVEVLKPISTASIGRWKTDMPAFDQKMADCIAGPMLDSLDYELARRGSFAPGEWLPFLALSTKYAATAAARRTLIALGWLTLNRRTRGKG